MSELLWSREAEQSVIGGLLFEPAAWDVISDVVTADAFADSRHRLIFETIAHHAAMGRPFDALTIAASLKERGSLDDAGGEEYIGDLLRNCPGVYNIATHAGIIRDRAILRNISNALGRCKGILEDAELTLHERAERAAAEILSAANGAAEESDLFTLKDGLRDLYDKLQADNNRGESLAGLSTGFVDVDARTSGLKPGELIIVAARPGMGKTNLALNIAGHNAARGKRVVFFSMEMSKSELSGRMAACMNGMDYQAMNGMEWERFSGPLGSFIADADSYTMLIDDRASQTMERIRVGCKKAKRIFGGLDLVVVDYLQLIQGKGQTRYEQVTNISRDLKVLAKDMGVPVLCLAQLNRGPAEQRRPRASDLRDSGAIEQDADVVALIHREDKEDGTTADVAELIFDKIRAGKRGIDPLVVDFGHCRFRTADRDAYMATQKAAEKDNKPKKPKGFVA